MPPAARGFEVLLLDSRVVDLGTEFGLEVNEAGQCNLQVFDGEVELYESSSKEENQKRVLLAGDAVARNQQNAWSKVSSTPDSFTDLGKLDEQVQDLRKKNYTRWLKHAKAMRHDERLITYFAMDGNGPLRKLKSSVLPRRADDDGAIVGAKRVAGRWAEKEALEFKHPADRVRVNIPGEFRSLTFACWVKIDSLDRWYNSLFLTDSYQRGEPHWQILNTGQLFFSVRVSENEGGPEHREVLSPVFWHPGLSGKWIHLATSYDVDRQLTSHYLNGELLTAQEIPDHQLVTTTRIGMASIGNWSVPTRPQEDFAIRNLNGSLDEFALFSVALKPEEVRALYEAGKP